MRQIVLSLKTGRLSLLDVPISQPLSNQVLIESTYSLISNGTERMLIGFGNSSFLDKARSQPDRVRDILDKLKAEGLINTFTAVSRKLDEEIPLGYCNVGRVLAVGPDVHGITVGDRVVSNGPHAEAFCSSFNLCAKVPNSVSDQQAAFTILASIGLHATRLINPSLGETIAISGLGIIGLLTAQILRANGCQVIGFDPDPRKCELLRSFGIQAYPLNAELDPVEICLSMTNGIGVDGVIVTASTSSNEPLETAAKCCRRRGRIVITGVVGMDIKRNLIYEKELSIQVSCSYGPGRYDKSYEEDCHDYPISYVRWTEQRNFEAILSLLSSGQINTSALVSATYDLMNYQHAYKLLSSDTAANGILLKYPTHSKPAERSDVIQHLPAPIQSCDQTALVPLSFIGAGSFTSSTLLRSFSRTNSSFISIASRRGLRPALLARRFNFHQSTTSIDEVLADSSAAIVVSTRHDSHAEYVYKTLMASKHVYVEKPLCLSLDELHRIHSVYDGSRQIMVGFNRRFSSLTSRLKRYLDKVQSPLQFCYVCNAGAISKEHWTQDPNAGGGRIIGEACHFVDLLLYLSGSSISSLDITFSGHPYRNDNATLNLVFQNGSIGTIHYYSNGSRRYPKEILTVFGGGKIFEINNFRSLRAWGVTGFRSCKLLRQDKGHENCAAAFIDSITNSTPPPIPFSDIFSVHYHMLSALSR